MSDRKSFHYSNLAGAQVDLERRQIIGFAVATLGPAIGKGEDIDETTLQQIADLGNKGPIRCRFNHPSGDSISSSLDELIGYATNFRVAGNKVLADFQAVSVESNPLGVRLLHLAKDAADVFGSSMVFEGRAENGKTRVRTLFAVDFVDIPAANADGLFSGAKNMEKCKLEKDEDGKYTVSFNGVKYEVEGDFPGAKKDAAEEPEAKKDAAETGDDKAVDKDLNKKDAAAASAETKTFTAADIESARKEGEKKAAEYSTEFETVMDASGFKGAERDEFRKNYLVKGQTFGLEYVKDVAKEKMAARTTAIGGGGTQSDKGAVKADVAQRFEAQAWIRRAWGCTSTDKTSKEWTEALAAYSASIAKTEAKIAEHRNMAV